MNENDFAEIFRQMAALAAYGARGLPYRGEIETETDWDAVLRMADRHRVLPLVGCAVLRDASLCPESMRQRLLNETRSVAAQNQVRMQRILRMIAEMEHDGLHVQLVKGYAVGNCYASPESRVSEDTDLLIPREQERAAYRWLRAHGFRVDRRGATSHHAVCQHPKLGMVELHVQLYDELIQRGWLGHLPKNALLNEAALQIRTQDGSYHTLGYTDHALFLTIHMMKHLIGAGINLRMMLDVALLLSCNRDEIDFDRYWRVLRLLRFDCAVTCVLTIMIHTGCFDWNDFHGASAAEHTQVEAFQAELVNARTDGANNAYYEYTRQIMRGHRGRIRYSGEMLLWAARNLLSQLYPGKERLLALYHVDRKQTWLLPVLFLRRMVDLPIQKRRDGITLRRLLSGQEKDVKTKMRLLKKLDML